MGTHGFSYLLRLAELDVEEGVFCFFGLELLRCVVTNHRVWMKVEVLEECCGARNMSGHWFVIDDGVRL